MIDDIARVLGERITSAVTTEAQIHEAVVTLIRNSELPPALHEFRLWDIGKSPRVDFFFTRQRIGLEVKIEGTTGSVVRQLYTYEPYVDGLILLTTKRFAIDQGLFDKPFRQVVLFYR